MGYRRDIMWATSVCKGSSILKSVTLTMVIFDEYYVL